MLTLHVARMDAKAIMEGEFSAHASKQYLAWSNSLSRTLAKIGLEAVPQVAPDMRSYLASKASAAAHP